MSDIRALGYRRVEFMVAAQAARAAAQEAAQDYLEKYTRDRGTCNFDQCAVDVRELGASEAMLKGLLAHGQLRGYYRSSGMWEGSMLISPPMSAQAGLRTVQAEAMTAAFKAAGFKATTYYQMD